MTDLKDACWKNIFGTDKIKLDAESFHQLGKYIFDAYFDRTFCSNLISEINEDLCHRVKYWKRFGRVSFGENGQITQNGQENILFQVLKVETG